MMLPQTVVTLAILFYSISTGELVTGAIWGGITLLLILTAFSLAHVKVYDEEGTNLVAETGPFKLCLCFQTSHKTLYFS